MGNHKIAPPLEAWEANPSYRWAYEPLQARNLTLEVHMHTTQFIPLVLAGALAVAATLDAQPTAPPGSARSAEPAKPVIILVHGAFADASGWDAVIRLLLAKGYEVRAVQNPLSSYSADIETTKRLIDAQTGPTVVVAHSYGGAVITAAAAGNPNVKALVYLAAFANDAGEPLGSLLEKHPSKAITAFRPDAAGFLTIDRALFHDIFAQDLPREQTDVMAVTQKPLTSTVFEATATAAAWRDTPTWFVVAKSDNVINPDLERFFAKRMGAETIEIESSHVVFMSHPAEVVSVIESAARAAVPVTQP